MSHEPKKPTRFRKIAGKRTEKTPRTPTDRVIRVTGPSGTMRDGKILFTSSEPLVSLWTLEFAISVDDLLFGLDRFRRFLDESMAREDDLEMMVGWQAGTETRIVPGKNPMLTGSLQVAATWKRPKRPGEGQEGGK